MSRSSIQVSLNNHSDSDSIALNSHQLAAHSVLPVSPAPDSVPGQYPLFDSPGFEGQHCVKFYKKACINSLSNTTLPGQSVYWRRADCSRYTGPNGDPEHCSNVVLSKPGASSGGAHAGYRPVHVPFTFKENCFQRFSCARLHMFKWVFFRILIWETEQLANLSTFSVISSCFAGKVILNAYQGGGKPVLAGIPEAECYQYCLMTLSCQAADYNKVYRQCFVHTSTSCQAHLTPLPQHDCCNHYKKSLTCS